MRREVQVFAVCRLFALAAEGGDGELHPFNHRFEEGDERPDGGDGDRARADEAHVVFPQAHRIACHIHIRRLRQGGAEVGNDAEPSQHQADEDGNPARKPHEITRAQQGEGKAHRRLENGRAGFEPVTGTVGGKAQAVGAETHDAGERAAGDDFLDAAAPLLRAAVFNIGVMAADLEDFRGGDPFRIRQVAMHDHRQPQRHGENHAENTASGTKQRRLPKRKTAPIAHHQQPRQDENHRRNRPRGGGLGLHQIVLQNIAAVGKLEYGHGNHRRRNGRGKSQPDLEAKINVGSGENDRNQSAQNHAAQRQLAVVGKRIVIGRR